MIDFNNIRQLKFAYSGLENILNYFGYPLFVAAGSYHNAGDALRTETQALLQAIMFAEQARIGRVIFAMDCEVLKTVITSNSYDAAPLGAMFREAKFLLQVSFIEYKVVYMHRSSNKLAHEVVALGPTEPSGFSRVWEDNYSVSVTRALSGDSTVQR